MLTIAVVLVALVLASFADWGAIGRGAGGLFRKLLVRERFSLRLDWDIQRIGPDGALLDRRRFRNLVVNAGLDALKDRMFNPATAQGLFGWLGVGTGVVPETALDVALGAEVSRLATTYTAGGTGVCVVERTFAAALGWEPAALSEAGLFDLAAAGVMFSRKTFPPVTKTAPDTIKVTVTITVAPA